VGMDRDGLTPGEALRLVLLALAATALALAAVRVVPPLHAAQALFDDWRIARHAPTPPQRGDIAVVALDEATLDDLACRSPIDRRFLAGLIERLDETGVVAIGLDVLVDAPTLPDADAALHRAIRDASAPVVGITALAGTILGDQDRIFLEDFLDGVPAGYANLAQDVLDGTVRRHRPRAEDGVWSFPAVLTRAVGGTPPETPFTVDWLRGPEPGVPPVPVYPATAAGMLPDAWLAGRVVLIGVVADDIDRHRTPLDRFSRPTPGVMIQAQVLAQMLDGRSAPVPPPWVPALLTLGAAAAGIGLGRRVGRPVVWSMAMAGLLALIWAGAFLAMPMAGLLLPTMAPSLALVGAGAVELARTLRQERRGRQVIARLFSDHLSPQVAERLWLDRHTFLAGGRPAPQTLYATVMFTDIAGSTAVSESLPPAELIRWLDGYVERMTAIVEEQGGVVLRFVGDGILAAFGVPVPRTDEAARAADAARAIAAARAMATAVAALNAEQERRALPPIGLRIGIESGWLTAGSIGGRGHVEYALIGDVANVAARLEDAARDMAPIRGAPVRVAVGGAAWRLSGETPAAGTALGTMPLRGRNRPVEVWQLDR